MRCRVLRKQEGDGPLAALGLEARGARLAGAEDWREDASHPDHPLPPARQHHRGLHRAEALRHEHAVSAARVVA